MADFELDLMPFIAPTVQVNTPDGSIEIRCDMTHIVAIQVERWMQAYRPFMTGSGEGEPPDMGEMFTMAANVTGKSVETMREWGPLACIRLLDFLYKRFIDLLGGMGPSQTNGTKPPVQPSGSPSRRAVRSR